MSNPLWTSAEAEKATKGKAVGTWTVGGLSIDTRSLQAGDLFVPLKDVRDGHDFIPQARTANAGAILSERADETAPALIVEDTLLALRALAVAARERSKAKRIAVTGSVGKTSVKEAIAAICEAAGTTHKSQKSFNNHWGAPLTVATMPKETDFGVFELGMNHAGELADLSPLVAPNVAVITKIAPAHLAFFENVDAIAAAKSEIFEGLSVGGIAVLNADDAYFEFLSGKAKAAGAKIISFGESEAADVRLANIICEDGHVSADLFIANDALQLSMPLDGAHWAVNGACSIAAGMAVGIEPDVALRALSKFGALPGRGETFEATLADVSVTVIDESYNANPESMRAAISLLGSRKSGRKLAVLGDMYELGKDELELHANLKNPLVAANTDRVIVVGECMRALRGALPRHMRGAWAKDWETALKALESEVQTGDTVLVKGSNATGLGRLVAKIKKQEKRFADAV